MSDTIIAIIVGIVIGAAAHFVSRGFGLGLMQDAQDCAVIVEGREHHAAWYQTLDHPDANLIEQAPELLRRLVEEVKAKRGEVETLELTVQGLLDRIGFQNKDNED